MSSKTVEERSLEPNIDFLKSYELYKNFLNNKLTSSSNCTCSKSVDVHFLIEQQSSFTSSNHYNSVEKLIKDIINYFPFDTRDFSFGTKLSGDNGLRYSVRTFGIGHGYEFVPFEGVGSTSKFELIEFLKSHKIVNDFNNKRKKRKKRNALHMNLGEAIMKFYDSNYKLKLEQDLARSQTQKIALILISSTPYDVQNQIVDSLEKIYENTALSHPNFPEENKKFHFYWTGWDWSADLIKNFDQPNTVAGVSNVFESKIFNYNNKLFEFLVNKFSKLCGADKDLEMIRPFALGRKPGVPKFAGMGEMNFLKDQSCGKVPYFQDKSNDLSDQKRFLDPSPWIDSGAKNSRIYYGRDAQLGRWPWFFSVGDCSCPSNYANNLQNPDDMHKCLISPMQSYFCGGSIISSKYGLSALHCFRIEEKSNHKEWLGGDAGTLDPNIFKNSITSNQNCIVSRTESLRIATTLNYGNDLRRIQKIYWPRSWNVNQYSEKRKSHVEALDVVLLKWRDALTFSQFRQPVCLPDYNTIPKNHQICWLVGYGKTEVSPMSPDMPLQEMALEYYPFSDCIKFYTFAFKKFSTQFMNSTCFNSKNKLDASQCSGDSGGPAVCLIEGRFVQFGTVSMRASKCGDSSTPASFGGVSSMKNFICDIIEEDERPASCV